MQASRIRVAILAGGRSSEHDISRLSAASVLEALDTSRFEPVPILIERNGEWRVTSPQRIAITGRPRSQPALQALVEDDGTPNRSSDARPATRSVPGAPLRDVDVVFPVLHGPYGEDGTIQGLLETSDLPYVGASITPSALGIDKALFKGVLTAAGIPVAPGTVAHARDGIDAAVDEALGALAFPMFVKPARMGSSIGISRATDAATLREAVVHAFEHDDKLVIESAIDGIEVECGVVGNTELTVSPPGEVRIAADREWYDFATKYEQGAQELIVPAELDAEVIERVRSVSHDVYRAIEGCGLARIDSFVTPTGDVIVNEVNTMPGFTATSAFPRLMDAAGIPYSELVNRLVDLALERHAQRALLRH